MNPAEDGLPKPQRYWAILTLMVGLAMSCLDTAIVNVALPVIAKDLHTSAAEREWAEGVIVAFAANPDAGTLALDGKMIDKPHLTLARRLLGLPPA